MRTLKRSVGAPIVAAFAAVMVAATAVAAIGEIKEDPGVCSRNVAETPSVQFSLSGGHAVWDHIPGLGISPELEGLKGSLTVVVFEGPHHAVPVVGGVWEADEGAEMTVPTFDNVLCVVSSTGEAFYYADVDFSGMNLSGLELDRVTP
jgi:hypothetical protein